MNASQQTPLYTVFIVSGGTKYNVTPALVGLDRSEGDGQIAQKVSLQLVNVQVDGKWLSTILSAADRVYVYANDGSQKDEVFRGFLWERVNTSSLSERDLQYRSYDNLIYFQESDESAYYSSGKKTKDVFTSLCKKWGIKLDYSYESITHSKLVLRGKLADIFTSDLLDKVEDETGKKYVVLSDKDTMYVKPVGSNKTVYHFIAGKNVIQSASGWTMDGMITKVKILGKADSKGREPVEATITGDTAKYGTLQKIIDRNSTSLSKAKKEAKKLIEKHGKPEWKYEIKAPDIPWIRVGDKVIVDAGDISNLSLIVTAIERSHSATSSEMTLTLEDEK